MKFANTKSSVLLLIVILFAITCQGCKKTYAESDDETTRNGVHESADDYAATTGSIVRIIFNGSTITSDSSVAVVTGPAVTIIAAGTYSLTGKLSDGQVLVDATDDDVVKLILNGVTLSSSSSSPLYIKKSKKTIIELADTTDNYLTDAKTYSLEAGSDEPSAALFSKCDLTLFGKGKLTVTGNYNDGISTKDGLVIKSGTLSVTSADDAIRGKDYVIVHDGNITLNSGGDGMKSDNDTDPSYGYIRIDSADICITTTAGDAISAQTSLLIAGGDICITTGGGAVINTSTGGPGGGPGGGTGSSGYSGTISEKALKAGGDLTITGGKFTINSADDAIHSNSAVLIAGDVLDISSGDDAVHADNSITITGATLTIAKSFESIESPTITVESGTISMTSADDSFNATMGSAVEQNDGSILTIKGGTILVNATGGDGIDSNGSVVMTGGTVIVHGPSSAPEVGIDVNGTFNISGGELFVTGPNSGNMIEGTSTGSSQYAILGLFSSSVAASTLINIEDSEGNSLITYKPVRSTYYFVYSSPSLSSGASYSVYTGGTDSGTFSNGVYRGGSYSGGTLKKTVTISSKLTRVTI